MAGLKKLKSLNVKWSITLGHKLISENFFVVSFRIFDCDRYYKFFIL